MLSPPSILDEVLSLLPTTSPRTKTMRDNVEDFGIHRWMVPTSRAKVAPLVLGMELVKLHDVRDQVHELCARNGVCDPSRGTEAVSFHYAKWHGDALVMYLNLSVFVLGTPGSMAISIDLAVSEDQGHGMSVAIGSLQRMLRRRKGKCVLFAQATSDFWTGKLTRTRRASVMVALAHAFDRRYKVYDGVVDMALFYE